MGRVRWRNAIRPGSEREWPGLAASATSGTPRARRAQIVDPVNFLLATRDTGYRSTSLAIAEFIDNSLQASARRVSVSVGLGDDPRFPLEITVTDDGTGMDAADACAGR